MADTGVKYPSSVTTVQETGDDNDWTTPAEVVSDNGVYGNITAASFDANDLSYLLKATNPSMGVPAGATINGILVEIERHYANGAVADEDVCLTKDGSARVGDDKSTGAAFPSSDAITSFGGATDLWGTTWTAAEINATTFGVLYKMKATGANADGFVDFIRVTVYYTAITVVEFAGVVSGTGVMAALLSVEKNFAGAVVGSGLMAAVLTVERNFAGAMTGSGLATAALTVERNFAGVLAGVGNAVADLTVQTGGAVVSFAGVLSGGGSALAVISKASGQAPWTNTVHAIMFKLTFANTTLRDQMKTEIDNWLVGKSTWDTTQHIQSGNDDSLIVRLTSLSDMEALMAFIEVKSATIPIQSGRLAKHWCGHEAKQSCQEIEVRTF